MSAEEPRVPVVDLPRVDAAQFQIYDHSLGSFLVTDDNAMVRWIDDFTAAPPAPVAADIETHGLDAHRFTITCVTASFRIGGDGGDIVSVLFDPLRRSDHRKLLARVFDHAAQIVLHNAIFDTAPLYAHRLMTARHMGKIGDTLIAARMIDTFTDGRRGLEDLVTRYGILGDDRVSMQDVFEARGLDKKAGWELTDIDCPTYAIGAMADTSATLRLWGTPGVDGEGILAEAARYLSGREQGYGGIGVVSTTAAEKLVEDAQQVNRIILGRTARGYRIDAEFPERFRLETEAETESAAQTLAAAGIRPGVGSDLLNALVKQGLVDPNTWKRTPTGRLKADTALLDNFQKDADVQSPLVAAHRLYSTNQKVFGYVSKIAENATATGRVHPEIKILGAQKSGRMCLPEDHRLLTRRGVVSVGDIRIGDRTLDADGEWTTVRAVHRYSDAEVGVYALTDGTLLRCTPEHRWVVGNSAGETELVTMGQMGPEDTLRLTPRRVEDLTPGTQPVPEPLASAMAVGADLMQAAHDSYVEESDLLRRPVSTGTAAPRPNRLRDVIALREERDADVRCWHRSNGLPAQYPLQWAMGTSVEGLQMLLRGAGYFDGNRAVPFHVFGDAWGSAFAYAFYRLGVRARFSHGRVEHLRWSESPKLHSMIRTSIEDVWCVTTDSGTCTAWGADGPYLTGNSASKPEIQQFPDAARGIFVSDDQEWISTDWSSIEPVVLAHASGDRDFLETMRAGADPYEPVGEAAGIPRKKAKILMLADLYGQGPTGAAEANNWTEERAKRIIYTIRDSLPILYSLVRAIKEQSKAHGHITTLSGRVLDQRITKGGYTEIADRFAPNYFCQGSALDILHHTVLELDRRGLSDHVHLWMHDEIIADVSIREELEEIMRTPPPFLAAVAEYHGINPYLQVDTAVLGHRWLAPE